MNALNILAITYTAGIQLNRENKTLFSNEGAVFNRLCQYMRSVLQHLDVYVLICVHYG